jgi:type IV pilus assembly protein PilB
VAIEPGGLSFSQALRALSEQDADALVVEDIRDGQTGLAMLEATEAGRLVVGATSAANPAAAIDMLLEMGLEPWTLAASLRVIISHAQVRRLCEKCRTPAEPSEQLLAGMGLSRLELDFRPFAPGACQDCGHSGYAGLAGLSSAMFIDKSLASLIRLGRDEELGEAAQRQGLRSLRQIALDIVRDGVTSLEELSRIMPE